MLSQQKLPHNPVLHPLFYTPYHHPSSRLLKRRTKMQVLVQTLTWFMCRLNVVSASARSSWRQFMSIFRGFLHASLASRRQRLRRQHAGKWRLYTLGKHSLLIAFLKGLRRRTSSHLKKNSRRLHRQRPEKGMIYSAQNTSYCIIIIKIQVKQSWGKPMRNEGSWCICIATHTRQDFYSGSKVHL